jgi:hypothetical protein
VVAIGDWGPGHKSRDRWADAQRGQAATGIARIRDGMAAYEATGTRSTTPLFLTLLAEALALAGKIEEGLAALAGCGKNHLTERFVGFQCEMPA